MYPISMTNEAREASRLFDLLFSMGDSDMRHGIQEISKVKYPMDIYENKENDELHMEMAIIDANLEDINIEYNTAENDLIIKYKKKVEEKDGDDVDKEKIYYVKKIVKRNFEVGFTIPTIYDIDSARVTYKNGLLSIVMPRKPESKPKKLKIFDK